MILPYVGDYVSHRDLSGSEFTGMVTERHYRYTVADGVDVDGSVVVTLTLARVLND